MDKMNSGILVIGILAVLIGVGWLLNKDGIITATVVGLIGLIGGSIFGFTITKKAEEIKEEKKEE